MNTGECYTSVMHFLRIHYNTSACLCLGYTALVLKVGAESGLENNRQSRRAHKIMVSVERVKVVLSLL